MITTYRARLFKNGGSQAVRLPKEFRFPGDQVLVRREGDRVILEPTERGWSRKFLDAVTGPADELFPERAPQPAARKRPRLK